MKVGIIVVTHQSSIRPTGHAALDRCIESINKHVEFDHDIIIVDNGSDAIYNNPQKYDLLYRPKQVNGLIGAWNDGLFISYEMNHDIHLLISDDIYFNETINKYSSNISTHEHRDYSVYGTLTDSKTAFPTQISKTPLVGYREVTNNKFPIHGWLFGFTRTFFQKYNVNGLMFENTHLFGGSETYFQEQLWKRGGRSFILLECLTHHEHLGAWRKLKNNGDHLKSK